MMNPTIFPDLADRTWAVVDLDAVAAAAHGASDPNPLLDPVACAAFVDGVAARLGVDHTYGGYMEDRANLWRGHYHAPGCTVHLGVDLNVPAGTRVAAPANARVLDVARDPDQGGGWGGVCWLELAAPYAGAAYLILGHLAHASLPEPGRVLAAGEVLASIGEPGENGGWYPHLHVQCFDEAVYGRHRDRLLGLDGYAAPEPWVALRMPDPTALVCGITAPCHAVRPRAT